MFKCSNCSADAQYSYRVNDAIVSHYCVRHLPHFLQAKKNAGELPLMVVAPEPEKPSKKKKEEPVIEEAVVEEAAVEDSAPTDADS